MARILLAPFAPRARRAWALLLPAMVVIAVAGCGGHRRSSLRPVYLRPSAGCPTGNCGGTTIGPSSSSSTSSSALTPVPGPSVTSEPSLVEPGNPAGSSVSEAAPLTSSPPVAPAAPRAERLPSLAPSLQGPIDEPGLEPAGGTQEKVPSATPAPKDSGASGGVGSIVPGTSLKSTNSRRNASGRLRQASLTDRLTPYVNEPADLFAPPKADRPWKYVVLHHSASPAGGYDSIDREHRERLGWQGCGYHFVIGNGTETPDGRIEVARRWSDQKHGVHCRDGKHPDVNEYGIGICLVGDLEKTPPTARQIAAAQALVAYLRDRYQIAADHSETHSHLAASPTSCPGRLFPARQILGTPGLALR